MKITSNPNDRHLLVAGASALAFVPWVVFSPPPSGHYSSFDWPLSVGRIAIFIAWLIYICRVRAKNDIVWNWKNFAIGTFTGGGIITIALVILGLNNYYSKVPIISMKTLSIHGAMLPIVYAAPYMAVAGMYTAFSPNFKTAAISGVFNLLTQLPVDVMFMVLWSFVGL